MAEQKDIRFPEKKVDEGWKDEAVRAKAVAANEPSAKSRAPSAGAPRPRETESKFMDLLTSLGVQGMAHLGEMPNPATRRKETNLEAAREVIDLLLVLKQKTEGSRSPEEAEFFENFLPELQIKFAEKA